MILYDRNLVIAIRAREVMGAEVDEERITWRNGCSIEGVWKVLMSTWRISIAQYQVSSCAHLYTP